MESCMSSHSFAIAHLYKEEKAMDMHIHDCYEIYYSIRGGKQFLIDNRFYTITPGDLFLINQYEPHKLTQIEEEVHERIVISLHPDYVKALSTPQTNLDACFSDRLPGFSHRLSLNQEQQGRFLYFVNKILGASGYAHDVLEQAALLELLVHLNKLVQAPVFQETSDSAAAYNQQVDRILSYINANIANPISIRELAKQFYLSESYICRLFKSTTGTTINKYVTARRISIAKALLDGGCSVMEAYERSGFNDYSNFFKTFTKAVGLSPKKYSQLAVSR